MRGRVVSTLKEYDELAIDDLGPRVRVDYAPDGEYGREWLRGLLEDLAADGLVEVTPADDTTDDADDTTDDADDTTDDAAETADDGGDGGAVSAKLRR
jgi:hypothetical protein